MFKKSFYFLVIALSILFIFNFVCFYITKMYTESFFISIIFANISILLFFFANIFIAFRKNPTLDAPIEFLQGIYAIVATVLNFIFIYKNFSNLNLNIVINTVILFVYIIILFYFKMRNAQTRKEIKKQKKSIDRVLDLKDTAEPLLNIETDREINKKIQFMYDNLASSQINTNINVSRYNASIHKKLRKLEKMLNSSASKNEILEQIENINNEINERNRIIKRNLV